MSGKNSTLARRTFLGAAAGAALAPSVLSRPGGGGQWDRLRVALVGTGIRGSGLWGKDLLEHYSDVLEMVGLCDKNPKRMAFVRRYIGATCPTFTDLDALIEKAKPQTILVTTTDSSHAEIIRRAMQSSCDVITEKPMVTDEKMCQEVLDTERRTGRKLSVAFNYRFSPDAVKIKEILESGEIGQVTSVDFNYFLDVIHGAAYFRRWHAYKQFSGSLFVHKGTHHFDLMNWWLNAEPVEVRAFGELRKYGWNGTFRGERCRTCPHKDRCEFHWDITSNAHLMNLYVKAESEDGYLRDACVFRKDINSWDTMSAQVRYHNGVLLNYSLNAFMPYEGFSLGFNGTKGRLDARVYHRQPWETDDLAEFRVTRNFSKDSRTFAIGQGAGGHWGADRMMLDILFRGPQPDPLGQLAGSREGAPSILIGVAARRSIEQQRPFKIEELVRI